MKVGVLITNGGPHPADKWAEQSAAQIADIIIIDPNSPAFDQLSSEKQIFENDLKAALSDHHDEVQTHEKDALAVHGCARLHHSCDPEEEHLDAAVKTVDQVASTKIFASHFKKPEVISFVRDTLGSHFASVKHIERSWHADNNSDHPDAQSFRARYHTGIE